VVVVDARVELVASDEAVVETGEFLVAAAPEVGR